MTTHVPTGAVLHRQEVGMLHPAQLHVVVRVRIEDALSNVEELRFTAVGSNDELPVKLRERCETEFVPIRILAEKKEVRIEERDGRLFTVVTLAPDGKLRPPTERQMGSRVAEGRLMASRNRNRARRCRRLAR